MKELTIEQKAKRFDEVLAMAKECITYIPDDAVNKYMLNMFPELKENEDERIRKWCIKLIKATCDYDSPTSRKEVDDAIDWLEKQGELKLQGKTALEAIKEEKVDNANKVEPKFKVKYACGEYNVVKEKEIAGVTYYGIEDEPNHIDYVLPDNCEIISDYGIKENGSPYPTKPAMFSEQKPTDEEMKELLRTEYEKGRADALSEMKSSWSEEDEERIANTLSILSVQVCWDGATGKKMNPYQKEIDWLKSLKDRVQPKQEWSADDEKFFITALWHISNSISNGDSTDIQCDTTDWLKLLKKRITNKQ